MCTNCIYISIIDKLCVLKGLLKKLKVGCMYAATFGCMYAAFGCMSMERLGACMRLLGAKSAATFGCMPDSR